MQFLVCLASPFKTVLQCFQTAQEVQRIPAMATASVVMAVLEMGCVHVTPSLQGVLVNRVWRDGPGTTVR